MFAVSTKAFNFKKTVNELQLNNALGYLNLFKKNTFRTPFIKSSIQGFFRTNSICVDKSRLAGSFSSTSKSPFWTNRPFNGPDEAAGPNWKSKNSKMVVVTSNKHTDLAREYETLKTLYTSNKTLIPSLDDLRMGLMYLELYDNGDGWESAAGSKLGRRQYEFDALLNALEGKDPEQKLAIMQEKSRAVFFYIDDAIPEKHLQSLNTQTTVVDCNTNTLPMLYQPKAEEVHIGKYKGAPIYTRKLAAADLDRMETFIGGLCESSRSFRFSQKTDELIATSIVANQLKNKATYILLVDDKGGIVGMADMVPGNARLLQHFYGKEEIPGIEDVKTFEFNFVVADRFQGRGLGKKLYQLVMQEAKDAGYMQLYAKVDLNNERAMRFCESVGMRKWSTSTKFFHYARLLH